MTLFDQEVTPKTKAPDVLTIVAHRKLGLSYPWSQCGWKRMDPDGLIVDVSQEYTIQKGERKGKRSWKGEVKQVFVSYAEAKEAGFQWEVQTGKCSDCGGDGLSLQGWSVDAGASYKPCKRCEGNGKPPTA